MCNVLVDEKLTMWEFALLKSFIEAFTQAQISLSRGTVQKLPHLKETWARLRGRKSWGLLQAVNKQINTRWMDVTCNSSWIKKYIKMNLITTIYMHARVVFYAKLQLFLIMKRNKVSPDMRVLVWVPLSCCCCLHWKHLWWHCPSRALRPSRLPLQQLWWPSGPWDLAAWAGPWQGPLPSEEVVVRGLERRMGQEHWEEYKVKYVIK